MSGVSTKRLLVSGVSLALFLLLIFSVPWTHEYIDDALDCFPLVHVIVEGFLDVLWVLVGILSFAHLFMLFRSRIHSRLHIFVSLIFVLALLFHVISADYDLAASLINDAASSQSISSTLKCGHERVQKSLLCDQLVALQINKAAPCILQISDLVSESSTPETIKTPRSASGNHSPPGETKLTLITL